MKLHSVPDALAAAEKIKGGPVVLAESSDSTGSGSPGDSTGVLKHLVEDAPVGPGGDLPGRSCRRREGNRGGDRRHREACRSAARSTRRTRSR